MNNSGAFRAKGLSAALCAGLLVSCGSYSYNCTVEATVTPADARADHNALPPGNQVRFSVSATTKGNCPLVIDQIGTWSTSDPDNTTISNDTLTNGLATCVKSTSTPATISNDGRVLGHAIATATLTCSQPPVPNPLFGHNI
jgi:hypothetical protein